MQKRLREGSEKVLGSAALRGETAEERRSCRVFNPDFWGERKIRGSKKLEGEIRGVSYDEMSHQKIWGKKA